MPRSANLDAHVVYTGQPQPGPQPMRDEERDAYLASVTREREVHRANAARELDPKDKARIEQLIGDCDAELARVALPPAAPTSKPKPSRGLSLGRRGR